MAKKILIGVGILIGLVFIVWYTVWDTSIICYPEETEYDVVANCPYTVADITAWIEYPDNNIFGLAAFIKDKGQDSTTIILAFNELNDSDIDSHIISEYDYLSGWSPYGQFEFDETEMINQDGFCYVRVSYDSRIDLDMIEFGKGDEECRLIIEDNIELSYFNIDYDNEQTLKTYQTYDTANVCWNDANSEVEELNIYPDYKRYTYTKLAVESIPADMINEQNGVKIWVDDYDILPGSYNIYGEQTEKDRVRIEFFFSSESKELEEQDEVRLYKVIDDRDIDITPGDYSLDAYDHHDDYMIVRMESSELNELEEGDYRLEYGPYQCDFKLSMQTFEEWNGE